jgi:hypothetical protein
MPEPRARGSQAPLRMPLLPLKKSQALSSERLARPDPVLELLKEQVKLDSELRQQKRNLQVSLLNGRADEELLRLLQKQGFAVRKGQLQELFVPTSEEYDPFTDTMQRGSPGQLVSAFVQAERHFTSRLLHKFSRAALSQTLENCPEQVGIEDLVRLVNHRDVGLRNRDVVLLFRRLAEGRGRLSAQELGDKLSYD